MMCLHYVYTEQVCSEVALHTKSLLRPGLLICDHRVLSSKRLRHKVETGVGTENLIPGDLPVVV